MRRPRALTQRSRHRLMSTARKLAWIVGLVALITGVSGFFMGLLQTSRQAADFRERGATWSEPAAATHADVPTAPSYLALRDRNLQPNHDWKQHTDQLPQAKIADSETLLLSPEEQEEQRIARAILRAYDGAPPVVPHPINQRSAASCLACHGKPVLVDKKLVTQISHPSYSQCLQCHAAGTGPANPWTQVAGSFKPDRVQSHFVGHRSDQGGARSYEGAPAIIPHTTWMRENCMSCHGPGGSSPLRTSHPSRQSCVQCHAADSSLDFRPLLSLVDEEPVTTEQP